MRFFVSRSWSRPGVATMVCTPRRIMSSCSLGAMPPMHSMLRMPRTAPPLTSASMKPWATSCVWRASSRDGQMTIPRGPSLRVRGKRASSSAASMTMGRVKARVLPEPVNAMPMRSRPERTAGRPWIWMGVGLRMPLALRWSRMGWGSRMSRKLLMGGGMSSPSTSICHLLRTSCCSSSDRSRISGGGRHPVCRDSVYTTPLASSATDMRGRMLFSMLSRISLSSASRCSCSVSAFSPPSARSCAR
mmetsp:Transcript_5595/g.16319  ORF Transcript_5595/g.16319 Transcript_5595/m.16319 type:complete len:246 (+) Transcript_5595:1160-1897(+)